MNKLTSELSEVKFWNMQFPCDQLKNTSILAKLKLVGFNVFTSVEEGSVLLTTGWVQATDPLTNLAFKC